MSKLLKQFLVIFGVALIGFTIIGTIGASSYYMMEKDKINQSYKIINKDEDIISEEDDIQAIEEKKMTVFGIYGTDKEGVRSDVIMICFFNHETKGLDIVSIPRDTRVEIPESVFSKLSSGADQTTKINHIFAYSEKEMRNTNLSDTLQQLFNIEIDYYATVSINAFKDSVDLLGGVPFYVPRDMHYSDPVQDLFIDLKKGQQVLDGDLAEQLVRFRKGYSNADIGRIEMQHEFMKAYMETALNDKNRLNLALIAGNILSELDTNFNKTTSYLPLLDNFNTTNVRMITIPGEAKNINGGSYYVYDFEKTNQIFVDILTGKSGQTEVVTEAAIEVQPEETPKIAEETPKVEVLNSKDVKIEILNGTAIKGIAGRTKTKLEAEGYKIETVGNASIQAIQTRIIVRKEGLGEDLVAFFKSPKLSVDDTDLKEGIDILIILGSNDSDQ